MPALELNLVDGDYFADEHVNAIEGAIDKSCPAGTVSFTVRTVAPSGWLMLDGSTVVNAQTLYPDLWSAVPVAWKSGSSLVVPNASNRVLIGAGVTSLGVVGGANSRTITAANLPVHQHAIDHDHASVTSSLVSNDHTHGFSATTGNESATHTHGVTDPTHAHGQVVTANAGTGGPGERVDYDADGAGSQGYVQGVNTGFSGTGISLGTQSANHTHSVSGTTGGISANHSHTVDLPNFTGTSGNGGFANTALDTTPAHLALNAMIKAH